MKEKNVCVAVLAAGASRRMGFPKLTAPFAGSTLLERALQAALESNAARLCVVTGAYHDVMAPLVEALVANSSKPLEIVRNERWEEGQSTSVAAAARYARRVGCEALALMVADQPFVEAGDLNVLMGVLGDDALRNHVPHSAAEQEVALLNGEKGVAVGIGPVAYMTCVGDRRGNPALFQAPLFDALVSLKGDEGARSLVRMLPKEAVGLVTCANEFVFADADTPEEFARLEGEAARQARRGADLKEACHV